ncbi:MAG TPA: hypothetical protein VIH99_12645 [Bdellovibrionota bacterium]
MKWKFALIGLLLAISAAAATYGYISYRRKTQDVCLTALHLSQHALTVNSWLREAAADPFLGSAAMRGPTNSVVAHYKERSAWIIENFGSRALPEGVKVTFQELSAAPAGGEAMGAALKKLGAQTSALHCEVQGKAPAPNEELAKLVSAGSLFWSERRAVAAIEKQEFAHDREIYCHADELIARLRKMAGLALENCKRADPKTKLGKSCKAKESVTGSIEVEIGDLERQKDLNLGKLRQKWPAGVLRGLEC